MGPPAPQLRQHLYFCTIEASKLSTGPARRLHRHGRPDTELEGDLDLLLRLQPDVEEL